MPKVVFLLMERCRGRGRVIAIDFSADDVHVHTGLQMARGSTLKTYTSRLKYRALKLPPPLICSPVIMSSPFVINNCLYLEKLFLFEYIATKSESNESNTKFDHFLHQISVLY